MARKLSNKVNVDAPSATYPFGRVKDNPGDNTGTPVDEALLGDLIQFFEKLMDAAGQTFNNQPENQTSGFQFFNALVTNIRNTAATETAKGTVERATQTEVNTGTDTTRYVSPSHIRNGTNIITSSAIQSNAVTSAKIADNSVTSAKIAANAVGNSEMADNAIGVNEIQDAAVTSNKIAANAVTNVKIADNAITLAKMASNSVDSDQYVDGSIDDVHLASPRVKGTLSIVRFEIGTWNMDTTGSKTVTLGGFVQRQQIRSVGITIFKDNGVPILVVLGDAAAGLSIDNTNPAITATDTSITLERTIGGFFDNADYDSGSPFNRGYVTITYEP